MVSHCVRPSRSFRAGSVPWAEDRGPSARRIQDSCDAISFHSRAHLFHAILITAALSQPQPVDMTALPVSVTVPLRGQGASCSSRAPPMKAFVKHAAPSPCAPKRSVSVSAQGDDTRLVRHPPVHFLRPIRKSEGSCRRRTRQNKTLSIDLSKFRAQVPEKSTTSTTALRVLGPWIL